MKTINDDLPTKYRSGYILGKNCELYDVYVGIGMGYALRASQLVLSNIFENTSLAAPGALAHRLQRRTGCNT